MGNPRLESIMKVSGNQCACFMSKSLNNHWQEVGNIIMHSPNSLALALSGSIAKKTILLHWTLAVHTTLWSVFRSSCLAGSTWTWHGAALARNRFNPEQTLRNSPDPPARDCSQSGKLVFSSGKEGLVTRLIEPDGARACLIIRCNLKEAVYFFAQHNSIAS